MQTATSTLRVADGVELSRRDWLPADEPVAVLATVHGYGEHGGRYSPLAAALVSFGYALCTFDLRGHGRSPGRRGHVERFDDYVDDARAFTAALRAEFPERPLYLFGHSLGGLIATRYAEAGDDTVAGLILASPFLRLGLPVSSAKIIAAKLLARVAPTRNVGNTLPVCKLSHDAEILRAYETDELNHHVATARWGAEMLAAQEAALCDAARIRLPLLLQYGSADAIVDPRAAVELYDAAGSRDKTCHRYEKYYHEIYNETGRAMVFADLIAWLDQRCGRSSEAPA